MNAEMYKAISREYELKRTEADRQYEIQINKVYEDNPDLSKIDSEIRALGIKASKLSILQKDKSNKSKISELLNQIEELKEKKNKIIKKTGVALEPKYNCDKCHDTGYITRNFVTERCSCMKQKLIDISFNKSNLLNLGKDTFEKFDYTLFSDKANTDKYAVNISPRENIKKIYKISKDFVDNFEKDDTQNLLFIGSTGTGKTFLSSCIANEIIKKGYTVLYQTTPILLDSIFEYKYNDDNKISRELYNNIYNANLLIIDDLGTENSTPAKFAELFAIINERLKNPKTKTVISSNFDLDKLSKFYDSRLVSRFIGNYKICKFFGEDLRLNKKS